MHCWLKTPTNLWCINKCITLQSQYLHQCSLGFCNVCIPRSALYVLHSVCFCLSLFGFVVPVLSCVYFCLPGNCTWNSVFTLGVN